MATFIMRTDFFSDKNIGITGWHDNTMTILSLKESKMSFFNMRFLCFAGSIYQFL